MGKLRSAARLRALGVLVVLGLLGCGRNRITAHQDQEEYVEDVVAFTNTSKEQVREKMNKGSVPLKEEWEAWEKQGPMTPERIKAFYKQTTSYIYELGQWHLWNSSKRQSDLALVEDMLTKYKPKNILDFGGGVGINAFHLARAGYDVTLADLDSATLRFAQFRAERRKIRLKVWKSDVEPSPPDKKYDVILALDVLEHLPKDELDAAVDKLIRLKHPKTEIIISAPFGRTAMHPMHLDADEHTKQQVQRLQTELPKE
jgi:2-polyprenyl-3-methyl-5-hydroxy-6-metoxy-1,4-benzoquinol methylase